MIILPQLVKKFKEFFGTQRVTSVLTTAHHLSPSWASSMHSTAFHPYFFQVQFNIILPTVPRLSKWSAVCIFSHQNPLCTYILPYSCHMSCLSHFFHINKSNNIWWGVQIIKFATKFSSVTVRHSPTSPLTCSAYCLPLISENKFHSHIKQRANMVR